MGEKLKYAGLVIMHTLALVSLLYSIKTAVSGHIDMTIFTTTHIKNISTATVGSYFYIIPLIQIVLTYLLFALSYGLFLSILRDHELHHPLIHKGKEKPYIREFDPKTISRQDINKLLFAFASPVSTKRLDAAKKLLQISKENPSKLYFRMDFFVHFLENKNEKLKWTAIDIIANLVEVDTKKIFDRNVGHYYSVLNDNDAKATSSIISNTPKILHRKPKLASQIVPRLKKIKKEKASKETMNKIRSIIRLNKNKIDNNKAISGPRS